MNYEIFCDGCAQWIDDVRVSSNGKYFYCSNCDNAVMRISTTQELLQTELKSERIKIAKKIWNLE